MVTTRPTPEQHWHYLNDAVDFVQKRLAEWNAIGQLHTDQFRALETYYARLRADWQAQAASGKPPPDDVPLHELRVGGSGARGLLEILEALQLVSSRGEARRLIEQKAVSVDGGVVGEPTLQLGAGEYLIRVGKRRFARVRIYN